MFLHFAFKFIAMFIIQAGYVTLFLKEATLLIYFSIPVHLPLN